MAERPLTPDLVCELHRILTEGTLDDPESAGRPRTDLLDLEGRGFLERRLVGKRFVFGPAADLAQRIATPGGIRRPNRESQ